MITPSKIPLYATALLLLAAFSVYAILSGADYLSVMLPGGLPLGNVLAAAVFLGLSGAAYLLAKQRKLLGRIAAIVLAAVDGGKVQLAAGVTADSTAKVKAGELVNFVAQQVGGKGGGKPDMAMAGGTDASGLPQALQSVQGWVAERL